MKPKDAARFANADSALFSELAAVVCKTGILPEKELHECWQMAEIVHRAFPEALHIADLAAGHGLLGWILVLMARAGESPILRTAVAVDITRSKSADTLAKAFKKNWPHLAESVYFVEGSIDAVRAGDGRRTVFVAVHACGSLSDRVLMAAVASGSSLAIMPCCHSLRRQASTLGGLARLSGLSMDAVLGSPASIDQFRMDALSALGYTVKEDLIQPEISAFHCIILGQAPDCSVIKTPPGALPPLQRVKRLGEVQAFEKIQHLDVSDAAEIKVLAARPSKEWARSFDLSFWIEDGAEGELLRGALEALTSELEYSVSVTIQDRFKHPQTQQNSVSFRFELKSSTLPITKDDALSLRMKLSHAVEGKYMLRG